MPSPEPQPIPKISVEALATLLREAPDSVQLIDVREPRELALASLPGFQNLPLSEYAEWSSDIHTRLDATKEIVVMCHHGVRSAQMCQWLMSQGFTQVKNVVGGIDAYALVVDHTVPQY